MMMGQMPMAQMAQMAQMPPAAPQPQLDGGSGSGARDDQQHGRDRHGWSDRRAAPRPSERLAARPQPELPVTRAGAAARRRHGTKACPTLFLANLPWNATEASVRGLFPSASGIYCSQKPLAHTEKRTS